MITNTIQYLPIVTYDSSNTLVLEMVRDFVHPLDPQYDHAKAMVFQPKKTKSWLGKYLNTVKLKGSKLVVGFTKQSEQDLGEPKKWTRKKNLAADLLFVAGRPLMSFFVWFLEALSTFILINMYIYIYICMYICIFKYIYIYICVYVYIYIYISVYV